MKIVYGRRNNGLIESSNSINDKSSTDYRNTKDLVQQMEMKESFSSPQSDKYYIEKVKNEVAFCWKNLNVLVNEKKEGLQIGRIFSKTKPSMKQILNDGNFCTLPI